MTSKEMQEAILEGQRLIDASPDLDNEPTEHPVSGIIRAAAKAAGIKHMVWSFAHSDSGKAIMVTGTTTGRKETLALACVASFCADSHHAEMLSEQFTRVDRAKEGA